MNKPTPSYYFYDLETTGLNSSAHRIVQFGGQRTDMDLNPIGESFSTYVAVEDGIVPDVMAVETTGISPQTASKEGVSELEFFSILENEIFTPGTIVIGYNNIRFDDEFIRYGRFRNLFDPYSWAWKDGRSRWDLLPAMRMARALRPQGIKWPTKEDGSPDNRLESIAAANGIIHTKAHDAMSDVEALIALTKLLATAQPKLFNYLIELRDKNKAADLLSLGSLFVHSTGKISGEHLASSIFTPIAKLRNKPGQVLLYDLRYSPEELAELTQTEIENNLFNSEAQVRIPIKGIAANKSPSIAPLGVLDEESEKRIKLSTLQAQENFKSLKKLPELLKKLVAAYDVAFEAETCDVEQELYSGGFISSNDRTKLDSLRQSVIHKESFNIPLFDDIRMNSLAQRFAAKNTPPPTHTAEMQKSIEAIVNKRLTGQIKGMLSVKEFIADLSLQKKEAAISDFTFDELMLYAESLIELSEETGS